MLPHSKAFGWAGLVCGAHTFLEETLQSGSSPLQWSYCGQKTKMALSMALTGFKLICQSKPRIASVLWGAQACLGFPHL